MTLWVLVTLTMLNFGLECRAALGERFPWRTDLKEARGIAAAEGKPIVIVFRCVP